MVEMFIKSINKASNKSKDELKKIHEKLRAKTVIIINECLTDTMINICHPTVFSLTNSFQSLT